jgi:hypothetical protein
MPRFSYADQISTPASSADSIGAVCGALEAMGATPRVADQIVTASLGSRLKVRLIGLTFGSLAWLPLKITIEVVDLGAARSIRLDVAVDFGFGSLAGVEGKCRNRCHQVLAELADGLTSRLPTAANDPVDGS